MITMAVINFLSRITYENTLSPMILARSGDNAAVMGIVNAVVGAAGIVGGIIVSAGLFSRDPIRMIYWSTSFSFLFGDILMGLGRSTLPWCIAATCASFPVPFIMAGLNVIMYTMSPSEMQGRVFAARIAIQCGTIPIGILLGGFLADYVFEPFMSGNSAAAGMLQNIVGAGPGSGMAVMFLCTGTMGAVFCLTAYRQRYVKQMRKELEALGMIKRKRKMMPDRYKSDGSGL